MDKKFIKEINQSDLFYDYYNKWIGVYKKETVKEVTMQQYLMILSWIQKIAANININKITRINYQ